MKKTRLTKSFIAILSASAMMALSSTAVFAADKSDTPDTFESNITSPTFKVGETPSATATCDVEIKVDGTKDPANNSADRVYKVTVDWDPLDFTYELGTWDTTAHVYGDDGGWKDDYTEATITVSNDSNWGVVYTPSWETKGSETINGAKATLNGVTATLSTIAATTIDALVPGDDTKESTFKVTVDGVPTELDDFTLSTVKVAISPAT